MNCAICTLLYPSQTTPIASRLNASRRGTELESTGKSYLTINEYMIHLCYLECYTIASECIV
jgi:hypothetical protein